jgi:hypothetical protein
VCSSSIKASATAASSSSTEPLPEGVDFTDPELQAQIDAMLRELDPELLLVRVRAEAPCCWLLSQMERARVCGCWRGLHIVARRETAQYTPLFFAAQDDTGALLTAADMAAAAAATQQQQQQPLQQQGPGSSSGQQLGGGAASAAAWQDEEGDEETESGLPDGVVLVRRRLRCVARVALLGPLAAGTLVQQLQQLPSRCRLQLPPGAAATHAQPPATVWPLLPPLTAATIPTRTRTTQSRADYKRKAAILLELLAAQRGEGEAAAEAFVQRLAAFASDLDEALLHMVAKRLQAAQQHGEVRGVRLNPARASVAPDRQVAGMAALHLGWGASGRTRITAMLAVGTPVQDAVMVQQLQDLQAVLRLEFERSQATPAMRLLDEVWVGGCSCWLCCAAAVLRCAVLRPCCAVPCCARPTPARVLAPLPCCCSPMDIHSDR